MQAAPEKESRRKDDGPGGVRPLNGSEGQVPILGVSRVRFWIIDFA
jgi:hypothetical protein